MSAAFLHAPPAGRSSGASSMPMELSVLLQAVGVTPDGTKTPPSNEDIFTTPATGAPVLTSAEAWGPTTGQATATPPEGVTFTSVGQAETVSSVSLPGFPVADVATMRTPNHPHPPAPPGWSSQLKIWMHPSPGPSYPALAAWCAVHLHCMPSRWRTLHHRHQ